MVAVQTWAVPAPNLRTNSLKHTPDLAMSGKENAAELSYGVRADYPIRQLPAYSKQPKRGLGPVPRIAPRARGRGRDNGRLEERRGTRGGVREDRKVRY